VTKGHALFKPLKGFREDEPVKRIPLNTSSPKNNPPKQEGENWG
jgi:hypothetical protein